MTNYPKRLIITWGEEMTRSRRRYEISDEEWERVKDMLPPERTGKPSRPCRIDN